jgi:hypothetical protein
VSWNGFTIAPGDTSGTAKRFSLISALSRSPMMRRGSCWRFDGSGHDLVEGGLHTVELELAHELFVRVDAVIPGAASPSTAAPRSVRWLPAG